MSQVKERPILFSGPMVQALLNGSKTQTRRAVKPGAGQRDWLTPEFIGYLASPRVVIIDGEAHAQFNHPHGGPGTCIKCPYGQPGERLWVRETWHIWGAPGRQAYDYAATCPDAAELKWKPSIHMPRAASRILLEIVSVRVERLQDISEADAVAEGIEQTEAWGGSWTWYQDYLDDSNQLLARDSYRSLWAKINGLESWDANPWVWVVSFKRITP